MSQETKLSILRSLLARVQRRAGGPRAQARSSDGAQAAGPDAFGARAAGPDASGARYQAAKPAEPPAAVQESKVDRPEPETEPIEAVPPSAPRVREAAVDALAGEPAEASPSEPPEEEMEIAITISDHPPAAGQATVVEIPAAPPVSGFTTMEAGAEDGQLELEELTPPVEAIDEDEAPTAARARVAPAADEPPPPAARPEPAPFVPPAPARAPAAPVARAAPPVAVPVAQAAPPAVGLRMMIEPQSGAPAMPLDVAPDGGAEAATRVEVAPVVHAAPLRGPVGTFIEQSRFFFPRSFGELLDASLGLGKDRS